MGFGKERRVEERMPAEIWLQSSASILTWNDCKAFTAPTPPPPPF